MFSSVRFILGGRSYQIIAVSWKRKSSEFISVGGALISILERQNQLWFQLQLCTCTYSMLVVMDMVFLEFDIQIWTLYRLDASIWNTKQTKCVFELFFFFHKWGAVYTALYFNLRFQNFRLNDHLELEEKENHTQFWIYWFNWTNLFANVLRNDGVNGFHRILAISICLWHMFDLKFGLFMKWKRIQLKLRHKVGNNFNRIRCIDRDIFLRNIYWR